MYQQIGQTLRLGYYDLLLKVHILPYRHAGSTSTISLNYIVRESQIVDSMVNPTLLDQNARTDSS